MKLSIRDLDLKGRRVFIRVDFNVPLKNGVIGDDTRIRSSIPTIAYALEEGATVILASHLGRPKGKPNAEFSLRPVAARLSELLDRTVTFADDCIGDLASSAVEAVHAEQDSEEPGTTGKPGKPGKVVLLENLRFHRRRRKTIGRSLPHWPPSPSGT